MSEEKLDNPRGRRATTEPSRDQRPVVIRMSGALHAEVVERCRKANTSINTWIIGLIEKEIETRSANDDHLNPYFVRHMMRLKKKREEKRGE